MIVVNYCLLSVFKDRVNTELGSFNVDKRHTHFSVYM